MHKSQKQVLTKVCLYCHPAGPSAAATLQAHQLMPAFMCVQSLLLPPTVWILQKGEKQKPELTG